MDTVKVEQVIKQRSDKYLTSLDQVDTNFVNLIFKNFLLSESERCLVIETFDTKGATKRIVQVLRDLKKNSNSNRTLEKYLTNKNQTFIEWMELFDVIRVLTVLPKFTSFLVCEFSNSVPLEDSESNVLSKIIQRYSINISKKIIFITTKKDLLNSHLQGLETRAFVKIDEFNKKVSSSIYKNKEEWFWECVTRGHVNDLEELLKSGMDANLVRKEDKSTALHIAAEKGYKDLVFTLLRHGANMLLNDSKTTPLHLAARNGHNDVVAVLLENDADVDVKEYGGGTALHTAAGSDNDVVKTLLEYGANVNANNNSALTALHIAALQNKLDIVETLLNYGADIYFKSGNSYTQLYWAAIKGNYEVVKVLIQKGAPLDITGRNGETLLHTATRRGFDKIVEILVESGANIGATNKGNETALDIATRTKQSKIIALLTKYKTK